MPRLNTLTLAGLLMAFSGAHLAPAQTSSVARLAVQSGNGQAACKCRDATLQAFQPISVKATDASGKPVSGATVNWSNLPVGAGVNSNTNLTLGSATTVTGADGISTNTISIVILNNFSSTSVPYLIANIQAVSNNNSVTFTETQALINDQGGSVIQANVPTFGGSALASATISGGVGTTLATPIQIQVAGTGVASNGVSGIAVRLVNAQASPTLTCFNNGGYADPGSVLSDVTGKATCYPVFNGSGTGQYYVTIGGVPDTDFSPPLDLQQYGPFTFTSIPGAPAAVNIVSGNNQVGNVGQTINNLVAKLVDAGGNAVQNQTMTWSVLPAGAVAITSETTVTDNSGQVSATVTLFGGAAAGAQITVALQSNPSISATFQVGLIGAITALNKVSGDNQSAQAGSNFANQLVVRVVGTSGPMKNYPVQFQTTGPVSLLEGTTVGTDVNGNAIVTAKAGATTGSATVTAVVGILTQTFNLTVTPVSTQPPPNGIAIVSGNSQSVVINTQFAPLVVQVNSTAGPVSGQLVNFSTTGPISLSTAAVTTGANGQAQVTVQAGATAGAGTVTASISGFSQTFNLTVLPPGPTITANSFLNAASRQVGAISPCGLAILSAPGLTPDGTADVAPAPLFGRLPLAVHNLSITFAGIAAPIVSVQMGSTNPEVTFQVPCEVTPGNSVAVVVNVGAANTSLTVPVQTVSPGILETTMSDNNKRAVVVRDDGSFADIGTAFPNPARRTENVRIYAVGLGATIPAVATNSIQNPNADLFGEDALVSGKVSVSLGGSGVQVISVRQAPDLIGVYEVTFTVPAGAPTGNDVAISLGIVPAGAASGTAAVQSLSSKIPIQ